MKDRENTKLGKLFSKRREERQFQVFQRAQIQGSVIIHDEDQLYIAPLNNISAGGLFVDSLVSLPEGRVVRVVVKSPRFEQPVQAHGTVVRIQGKDRPGLAVEFTSISSRARDVIKNCVQEARMESALKVV
jgi:hypothetical protein